MKFLSLVGFFVLALSSGAKAEQTIGQKLDSSIGAAEKTSSKYAELAKLQAELAMLDAATLVDTETRSYGVKFVDSLFMLGGGYAVIKVAGVVSKIPVINKFTATRAATQAAIYLAGSYLLFEGVKSVDGALNATFVVSESKLLKMKSDISKRITELNK